MPGDVVELVDTLGLEPSAARRGGSTPSIPTIANWRFIAFLIVLSLLNNLNIMKKGYWIGQVRGIKNQELFNRYFEATAPLVERGDYKLLIGGPVQKILEGDEIVFSAVLEFDSLQRALDYYDTEDYQKALRIMGDDVKDVVLRNLVVVEGP